jgi:hypothetical protein
VTPVLAGRLQTRLLLSATVGGVWTAAITPILPAPAGTAIGVMYRMTFESLALMTVLGLGWELLYHLLQQVRWDKDWPTLLGLVTVLNEAIALWFVTHALSVIPGAPDIGSPYLAFFAVHVGTTWLLIWLFLQGPVRVLHLRWRFEGGRVLVPAPGRRERRDDWLDIRWLAELRSPRVPSEPPAADAPDGVVGMPRPAGTTAPLVEGVLCANGHFGSANARYCAVCGTATPTSATPGVWGPRPPLGVLILADGSTRVLDGDLSVTESAGSLAFHPLDEPSAAPTLAEIRLVGWQPVVSSSVRPISLVPPTGGKLRAGPGVSVPLEPGATVLLGEHAIRYDSPYAVESDAVAAMAGKEGTLVVPGRRSPSSENKRTAAAVAGVVTLAGAAAFGILSGGSPAANHRVSALSTPPVGGTTSAPLLPSFSVPAWTLPGRPTQPVTGLQPVVLPGPPTGPVLRLPSLTLPPPPGTTPPVGPPPTSVPPTTDTPPPAPPPTPLPTSDLCAVDLLGMLQCTIGGLGAGG